MSSTSNINKSGDTGHEQSAFGETLRALRLQAGLGLHELSEKTGIHRGNLSRLEAGIQKEPSADTLAALARGLGVDIEVLYDALWTDDTPMPTLPTYFRRKYGLSDSAIAQLERRVDALTSRAAKEHRPHP